MKRFLALWTLAVALVGCNSPETKPTITSFSANPASIQAGESSTLSWTVNGATSLSIDNGVGDVTGQESVSVMPEATTAYTLTATNSAGSSSEAATVTVNADELDLPFTAEELTALEAIPEESADLESIILPNGRTVADFLAEYEDRATSSPEALKTLAQGVGPQAQKNLIIARMAQAAATLTTRSNFTHAEEPAQNGVLRPAQEGLAYAYNSKQYQERRVPPAGDCKSAAVYGLDCSGFVYQLARAAGFSGFPVGPANLQRMPETWNKAFEQAGLEHLKAEDLGQLSPNDFETGDIIYWLRGGRAYHVGVVFAKGDGGLGVFQSNGAASGTCEANYGPKRGPRALSLGDSYWFGGKAGSWGVVRFVTEISGKYNFTGAAWSNDRRFYPLARADL